MSEAPSLAFELAGFPWATYSNTRSVRPSAIRSSMRILLRWDWNNWASNILGLSCGFLGELIFWLTYSHIGIYISFIDGTGSDNFGCFQRSGGAATPRNSGVSGRSRASRCRSGRADGA